MMDSPDHEAKLILILKGVDTRYNLGKLMLNLGLDLHAQQK